MRYIFLRMFHVKINYIYLNFMFILEVTNVKN